MAKPRVIVVNSDQHCGSTLGLMTPEGVTISDGAHVTPSDSVRWLWRQHLNFVDDAERIVKEWRKKGATAHYINLGDLTDGDHHQTHQIIGRDQGSHIEVARRTLKDGFLGLKFDTLHFVMGTPSHVGRAGGLEKSIASGIEDAGYPVIRCPWNSDTTLWPYLYMQVGDYRFDFRHHGRSGQREHTRKSYQAIYAYDIHGTHVNEGRRPPDVAVRAHKHKMMDSGPDLRGITRVINTGCWQFASEWVRSAAIESQADFGGWVFVVTDDMRGPYDLWARPFQYNPDPLEHEAEVWTP